MVGRKETRIQGQLRIWELPRGRKEEIMGEGKMRCSLQVFAGLHLSINNVYFSRVS